MELPAKLDPSAVRPEHRSLYKYLRDRYAHRVVLSFNQIEDLLNAQLPESARLQREWWTDLVSDGAPSPQAHAWVQANRSAVPDLMARTVTFERVVL